MHDGARVQVLQHAQEGVEHHLHRDLLAQAAAVLLQQAEQVAAVGVLLDHDHAVALLGGMRVCVCVYMCLSVFVGVCAAGKTQCSPRASATNRLSNTHTHTPHRQTRKHTHTQTRARRTLNAE